MRSGLLTRQGAVPTVGSGTSRWPYRLAVLLATATFPLISVGGLVTSYDAGMAVPDWPNTYGYNLLLYPWTTWLFGPWDLFLEHGHRLLGVLVGLLAIGLVVAVYLGETRRWVRTASWVALVLVIAQGTLGGARVLLDDRQLAMIHGCFGPAFFAYCVGLAALMNTSAAPAPAAHSASRASRWRRFTLLTATVVYVQLVLGAQMRHIPVTSTPLLFNISLFLHLANALVLTSAALLLGVSVGRARSLPALRRPVGLLVLLVCLQLVLGVSTWIVEFGWPYWFAGYSIPAWYTIRAKSMLQTSVTTAHMAMGSLILATSVLVHLRARQALPVAQVARGSPKKIAEMAR